MKISRSILIAVIISSIAMPLMADESSQITQIEANIKLDQLDRSKQIKDLLSKPLTRRSALAIGFINNYELFANYYYLQIRNSEARQSMQIANPSVGLGISTDSVSRRTEFSIEQDLLSWILHPTKAAAVDALTDANDQSFNLAFLEFSARLSKAFFAREAAESMLELQSHYTEAAQASFDLRKRQFKSGNINELQLKTAELTYQQAQIDLQRSKMEFNESVIDLQNELGLETNQANWKVNTELENNLPEIPSPSELDSLIEKRRPDLLAIRLKLRSEGERLTAQAWQDKIGTLKGGIVSTQELDGRRSIGPKIELGIPIISQNQQSDAEKEATEKALTQQLLASTLSAKYSVRKIIQQLEFEKAQVTLLKNKLIPAHSRIVELNQANYNFMLTGAYTLIQSKQDEVKARQDYIIHLTRFWNSWVDLEVAVGGPIIKGPEK